MPWEVPCHQLTPLLLSGPHCPHHCQPGRWQEPCVHPHRDAAESDCDLRQRWRKSSLPDMMQYYVQADGIPKFNVMMENAPKKEKRAGMPIADVKLVMMALMAVLAAQHFPREVNDWESLPAASCTWQAWKVAFRLAHLKRQRQLQALGGGEPLGSAHVVIPTASPTMDRIGKALENLALAATNDTTILQQLKVANLALTALVTSLTAANKKLADLLVRNKGGAAPATLATPAVALAPPKARLATRAFLGNYC
jgi:hypothetical protein